MRTIWKKTGHRIGEPFECTLPLGSQIVSIGEEYRSGRPAFWFLVDTDMPGGIKSNFVWVGTGHAIPTGFNFFIGSAGCHQYVWHLFNDRGLLPVTSWCRVPGSGAKDLEGTKS